MKIRKKNWEKKIESGQAHLSENPQARRLQQQTINVSQEKSIDKSILCQKLRIMKFYSNYYYYFFNFFHLIEMRKWRFKNSLANLIPTNDFEIFLQESLYVFLVI